MIEYIDNLYHLDEDRLIANDKGNIFIVNSATFNPSEQTCQLNLTEVNSCFTSWKATYPIATNRDHVFVNKNDKDFSMKLAYVDLTRPEAFALISNVLTDKTPNFQL